MNDDDIAAREEREAIIRSIQERNIRKEIRAEFWAKVKRQLYSVYWALMLLLILAVIAFGAYVAIISPTVLGVLKYIALLLMLHTVTLMSKNI